MSTSRSMAWCIWLAASIFYAYQNILRVMPNIMLNDLMHQFHVDAAVFGQLSGVYYIAYSLMHIPIGLMLDRVGPKLVLPACVLMTVLGLCPILFADHWAYAFIGRALLGAGSSAAILGTFKIIRMTFEEKNFSKMLGFSVLIGLLGAIYGGGPISQMCSAMGYKAVVQIVAVAGIILAGVMYILMPHTQIHEKSTMMVDIKKVFTNGRVMVVCLSAGLMVGPLEGFADVWGATFLKEAYGLDIATASYTTSMIFMGMCVGAPLLPAVADKIRQHLGVVIVAGVVMALAFVGLLLVAIEVKNLCISFFVIGICCAYQIVAIYKASTYVPEHMVGLTTAVANMIIMSFGYAFHALIGYVVYAYGSSQSVHALFYGVSVIPIALTVGILGFSSLILQRNH